MEGKGSKSIKAGSGSRFHTGFVGVGGEGKEARDLGNKKVFLWSR